MRGEGKTSSGRDTRAVRSVVDGSLTVLDGADAAGVSLERFLDLLDRYRSAEAGLVGAILTEPVPATVPDVSVVVPVYNEESNIPVLVERLLPVLAAIGSSEIVFIDDLSTDGSVATIRQLQTEHPEIVLVPLARNFGHQGALTAGLEHAGGHAVVLMDADLQDPPEVVTDMVARWREGFDVVYAIREKRKEGAILRACFFIFYRLLQWISEIELPFDSGDFCLMDRQVVEALNGLPESNRFLRGLRGWVGFRQIGITYERAERHSGETKYSVAARVRFAVDGLLSFSDIPLRLASLMGFLATGSAVIYLLIAVFAKVFGNGIPQGWTSIIFVQLIVGGVQLIMMGVAGEYLARTYHEVKRRPAYVVQLDDPERTSRGR